jgi:EAL domain-containing protein (putative c-di-GMP-specific phosphodiesterase class I)
LEREQDAVKIAGKILDSFSLPFFYEEQEVFLSANIGIAVSSCDGENAEALVRNADAAMRRAHLNTKSDFHFYTPDMNETATRRLKLIRGLRHALERQELCLHYQPVIDLVTNRVTGVEALLRWRHPVLGLVSPGEFIPLAEEDGVIVPIGEWVLREGCAQIKRWEQQGLGRLRLAVNLSARQFSQDNLPLRVAAILAETGVRADLVEIELTESMLARDVEDAVVMMKQLKFLGVSLSIDDFGTGYSSLSYLKRFPLDVLKIDQSFVREIPFNADDIQICSTIVAMAHGFNFRVIAEGAETLAQVDFLKGLHCDEIQGYYFSKPLPPKELVDFLLSREEQWQSGGGLRRKKGGSNYSHIGY